MWKEIYLPILIVSMILSNLNSVFLIKKNIFSNQVNIDLSFNQKGVLVTVSLLLYKISKLRHNKSILDRVSLYLPKGCLAALLGPSGSGKSSLLRVIAGLDYPSKGIIWLNERDVTKVPIQYRNMGFVCQNFSLFKDMNVRENISFGLKLRNFSDNLLDNQVDYFLDALQISDVSLQYPHQISGGQKQRVALARSLAIQPDLLLLDEPFKALDNQLRTSLSYWLRNYLKEKCITTLMVTHEQKEAILMADEILIFNQGHLVQQGEAKFIYDNPINKFVANFFGPLLEVPKRSNFKNSLHHFYKNQSSMIQQSSSWFEHTQFLSLDKNSYYFRPYQLHLQQRSHSQALSVSISSIVYKRNLVEIVINITDISLNVKLQVGYAFFTKMKQTIYQKAKTLAIIARF